MPWYPQAGQVVEPVVYCGGGGHGLTHNPFVHIGFLGLGSWALRAGFLGAPSGVAGVGGLVALGRQPRPSTNEDGSTSVLHATAVNP